MTEPTADDVSILQLRCVDTAIDPAQDQPGAAWRSYPFTMQPQERTQWCWAAVAASVAGYYDATKPPSQTDVAGAQLGRNDCSQDNRCNIDGYLMAALRQVGHLKEWDILTPTTEERIYFEVDGRRPLCARLVWSFGTAHFVTIIGYAPRDVPENHAGLAIADPFWGLSDIDHEDFPSLYAYGATWTDTYFTELKRRV